MRIQTTDYNCGIFATYNALSVLGSRPSLRKLGKLTNTTAETGTNEFGIMQALIGYGYYPRQFHIKSNIEMKKHLNTYEKFISESGESFPIQWPIIACVDKNKHWVVIAGCIEDRYLILDSNNTLANKAKNGIHSLNFSGLAERWKYNGVFYGITIER
jgi:ABC-type bacteriocin/lantibiotic exporter with double-glycine peptidase domain